MKSQVVKITIATIAVLLLLSSCSNTSGTPEAFMEKIGGVRVISLYGSWEEMGRQFGELAGVNLRHVHDDFMTSMIKNDPEKSAAVDELSDKLFSRYPYRFRRFLEGVSQSSGLSITELKAANAVEYAEGSYCSGMAVWGDYSNGPLVYGRNYDAISFKPIAEDILITVFHPSDGSLAVATIGYAGEVYAVNAINEKGLFLEVNNGMASAGFDILFDRFSSTASLMQVLFDAPDLDYLDAFFKTHRSNTSFIIGVADEHEARSYEWCAIGTERADGSTPDGLMVMTNHYVNPSWTFPVPDDEASWMSLTRRSNMLSLAATDKGSIDAEMMCRLISTPIAEGGPKHPCTRYQLVYEPQSMKLLVNIESAPQWTEIDMKKYMCPDR